MRPLRGSFCESAKLWSQRLAFGSSEIKKKIEKEIDDDN